MVNCSGIFGIKGHRPPLTVDDDGGGGAPPPGHDVFSHAGVVGCVREAGLLNDEVVVNRYVEIPVVRRIDDLLVLQPLHLCRHKGSDMIGRM